MSFDTILAKSVINSLRAHSRGPGGEIMEKAANILQDALIDALTAVAQVRGAEAEAIKAKNLYEDALLEIKRLRESSAMGEAAIVVLRDVASTKKGASSKAHLWLEANGKLPPAPVVASATPAEAKQ